SGDFGGASPLAHSRKIACRPFWEVGLWRCFVPQDFFNGLLGQVINHPEADADAIESAKGFIDYQNEKI
ncbi:MAG: hypothetical protein WCS60_00865, partial [Hydrogenophaga sp.]